MLGKTLSLPEVERLDSLEEVKQFLGDLVEDLQKEHRAVSEATNVTEKVIIKRNGYFWRITIKSTGELVFEAKLGVNGTWKEQGGVPFTL